MLTLETERLILRDFLLEDWDALNVILSDPQVTRFMHFASWDEAERREWFEWLLQNASSQERDAYIWAVTLRESGALIGWFGIERAKVLCVQSLTPLPRWFEWCQPAPVMTA